MSEQDFKVRGHPNLIKRAGVVLNEDKEAFHRFIAQREKVVAQNQKVQSLEDQLKLLQEQVAALINANKDDGK